MVPFLGQGDLFFAAPYQHTAWSLGSGPRYFATTRPLCITPAHLRADTYAVLLLFALTDTVTTRFGSYACLPEKADALETTE